MSLFTPPSTSHRNSKDKENRDSDPGCIISWSFCQKVHNLTASPKFNLQNSASKLPPAKSILKKPNAFLSPFTEEPQRQLTPEPSDPLTNLTYLEYPVSKIVQVDPSATELREIIEAYSILTARLRASVTGSTDVDASWPLFQPLRKNKKAFINAVVRDLDRAFVDPCLAGKEEPAQRVLLPSPKNTPKKKRDGMTAEQVKYARDLCTTCHATIRLLSLIFTLPAIQNIFTDVELRIMFTAMLAIPLADNLPTPNARKTYALAIWLIQTQRLPSEVLAPAADRIAFALCRGIDGELGKEGKKGAASDGLKAVHDLSIHLPSIFVPKFTHAVLPSVLSSLLAPTLTLRTHACHALGGFVIGATEIPRSAIHARISKIVSDFITTPPVKPQKLPTGTPSPSSSPSKSGIQDPTIVRTLRTTLQATEVNHVAHGPVWGLSVLSSFLVLLNSALTADAKLCRIISALMGLGMRHKKSSVRGLGCLMWRCVIWVYMQPPLLPIEDGEEGEEEREEKEKREEREKKTREQWWQLITSVTELETGVCTIVAQLGSCSIPQYERWEDEDEDEPLRRTLQILNIMVDKDVPTCGNVVEVLKQLVSGSLYSGRQGSQDPEHQASLIPRSLFSSLPGLLSTDYKCLTSGVNPIYEETPKSEDVRRLTREEIGREWVWKGLVKAWKGCLGSPMMWEQSQDVFWKDLICIWEGLIGVRLSALQDAAKDDTVSEFAMCAVDVLIDDVLQDANLDLSPRVSASSSSTGDMKSSTTVLSHFRSNSSTLKLAFARDLWSVMRNLFPHALLANAGERLLACLMKNADDFTNLSSSEYNVFESRNGDVGDEDSRNEKWVSFCVDVLSVCGVEALRAFWGYPSVDGEHTWEWCWGIEERCAVWRIFVQRWMEQGEAEWEGAVVILGIPFMCNNSWNLVKEDAGQWDALLQHTIAKALDYGHDSSTVLSSLATSISTINQASPTAAASCIQLAEFFMTHMVNEITDAREVPEAVLDFVNDTMRAAYPPTPREKMKYLWTARAIMDVITVCPRELVQSLLVGLLEGICVWIEDESVAWTRGELEYDIIPLYQTILVRIQDLSPSKVLHNFAPIIGSPFLGRNDIQTLATEPFREFWISTFVDIPESVKEWPEEIRTSLQAVFGEDESTAEEPFEEPTTPTLAPASRLSPIPHIPALMPTRPCTPTTPTASISQISAFTPPRPHKPLVNFFAQLPLHPPGSPVPASITASPNLAQQTPSTPKHIRSRSGPGSPKRRKIKSEEGDKENRSPPRFFIQSVEERIALHSPYQASSTKSSALGKRKSLDGEKDGEGYSLLKKPKKLINYVEDSEEERIVESSNDKSDVFVVGPGLVPSSPISTNPAPKKRKGVFMDAVELPHLHDMYPRLRSSSSFNSSRTRPHTPSSSSTYLGRRTCSDTKIASRPSLVHYNGNSSRKRRRTRAEDVFSSSPIRVLDVASSDPFDLKPKSKKVVSPDVLSELSSDDDPHIGQVTPHHLISPELRKGRNAVYEDPPSDDSIMVASPSRDIVERRLQRLGSLNTIPAPLPSLML